jgi:3-hydroxyisobutyrate dehydrogenase
MFRLGLDPVHLSKIINTSSGRCWSTDTYNPVPGVLENVPASRGYVGGFGNSLMAKDLGLAQNVATKLNSPIPLGSMAHQMYRILSNIPEFKDKDFSSIYEFLKRET